jgi:hypothetical protein
MVLAFKIALALIGFGVGVGGALWLARVDLSYIRHLGLTLEIGVFVLAVCVVIDASLGRIGPGSRPDALIYWALWGGLAGVLVAALILLVRRVWSLVSRSKRE